jgi:hypothetical protein
MARLHPLVVQRCALSVALVVASTFGCSGKSSDQRPDSQQKSFDPAASAKAIHGKWENTEKGLGLEFYADGIVKLFESRRFPRSGTYKLLDDKTLEVKFPNDEKPVPFRFDRFPTTLTLTTERDAKGVVYKAVDGFAKELNNPNRQPNEQQRKWIVGSWRGAEKAFGNEDVFLNAYYPDDTFSALKLEGITHQISLEMGTYRVHPDADNFLELTYPDTGKTETVYAEIGEKELSFEGFGGKLRKHQGVDDKEERTKPVRPDVLTAFALFRECAADPEKSKEKYADKPVELTGSVGGYRTAEGKSEISLITGKASRVKCVLDTTDKATADALRKIHLGSFTGGGLHCVTVKGTFEGIVKEEDKSANQVAHMLGGVPTDKGPQLFIHLSECKIVAHSELKVK